MIKVLIVDDQLLIRTALRSIVGAAEDIEVVGEAADGSEAHARARALLPDVLLMDIHMPVVNGIEATAAIVADPLLATTKIIMLTTFEEDANVLAALRAGASGFLGKGSDPHDLMVAIRTVAEGGSLLSSSATTALITAFSRGSSPIVVDPGSRLQSLTAREIEMLAFVADGFNNAEISELLHLSIHTVKTHVKNITAKAGVRDRVQLVILGKELGLTSRG